MRGLPLRRGRVFQDATGQKERSPDRRVAHQADGQFHRNRFPQDDWIQASLLDLPREKQSHCAIMMLIVRVMMDELVNAWANSEHSGPLEHRPKEQSNNHCSRGRIGNLPGHRLLHFPFPLHAPEIQPE
jgi:hypothetical protein